MNETEPRLLLAERYGRMLRSGLGSRAIKVACEQEALADGEVKVSWRMVVDALSRG